MNIRTAMCIIFTNVFVATATQAQLTTITFDPPALPGGSKVVNVWIEKGFIFRGGDFPRTVLASCDDDDNISMPNNGTAFLEGIFSIRPLDMESKFNIYSIDVAEYRTIYAVPTQVTFTGFRGNREDVATSTFTLDGIIDGPGPLADFQRFYFDSSFQNLDWIEITLPFGSAWPAMDNVVVSIIPEPATLSLLAVGGIALLRKRRA